MLENLPSNRHGEEQSESPNSRLRNGFFVSGAPSKRQSFSEDVEAESDSEEKAMGEMRKFSGFEQVIITSHLGSTATNPCRLNLALMFDLILCGE